MHDYIIIGSGPAGVAAALQLQSDSILMLDVGNVPGEIPECPENLYEKRKRGEDLFDLFVGDRFQGLNNIYREKKSLKLKSPHLAFITEGWETLCPVDSDNFDTTISLARGGLANAWGAGAYRFSDEDLQGFPVNYCDLKPYYDRLSQEIGISGLEDDLTPYFQQDPYLMPPIKVSQLAAGLLNRYGKQRDLCHSNGLYVGMPRLAVLTEDKDGRPAYRYDNCEFFLPHNQAVYNPEYTLRKLIDCRKVSYLCGELVDSFSQEGGKVTVFSTRLSDGKRSAHTGKHLLIAAGTVNSSRIVLKSLGMYNRALPICDNLMSTIPVIDLQRIGSPIDYSGGSMAQLNMVYHDDRDKVTYQGSFYESLGPLRADVAFELPFSIGTNIKLLKFLSPAMGFLVLFYPGQASSMTLRENGTLKMKGGQVEMGRIERKLISLMRKLGYFGFPFLVTYSPMGSGLHYACSLPMKETPGSLETDRLGRLTEADRVHVVDGACFSRLPAKNLTLTIMANAMRIADRISRPVA